MREFWEHLSKRLLLLRNKGDTTKDDIFRPKLIKGTLKYLVILLIPFMAAVFAIGTMRLRIMNIFRVNEKLAINPITIIVSAFKLWPITLFLFIFLVSLIGFVAYSRRVKDGYDEDQNVQYKPEDGTYGTARKMTEDDPGLRECFHVAPVKDPISTGDIVGAAKNGDVFTCKKPIPGQRAPLPNSHMCVTGPSGSGKSRCLGFPMIFQAIRRGESYITTETSGELYRDTAEIARKNGYTVRLLDYRPHMAAHSDSFNVILQVVKGSSMKAKTLAQILCDTASKEQDFWINAQLSCLTAIILIVDSMAIPKHEKSLAKVYEICCEGSKKLSDRFKSLDKNHPAYFPGQQFINYDQKVKDGAIGGLAIMLQVFADESVKHITSYDEVDITLPGREKCAYYVIISDNQRTLEFLSSSFFNFLFSELIDLATLNEGLKLKVPVNIMMDEFVSIGIIDEFVRKLANVRKYLIRIMVLFQDIPQLKETYGGLSGDAWKSIISNCSINIALGCNEAETTAQLYSDLTGVGTVEAAQQRVSRNSLLPNSPKMAYQESNSLTDRAVMLKDEIMRMKPDEQLVIVQGKGPIVLKKFDYSNHYMYKEIVPVSVADHVPEWWKYHPEYFKGNKEDDAPMEDENYVSEEELNGEGDTIDSEKAQEKADALFDKLKLSNETVVKSPRIGSKDGKIKF